MSERTVAPGGHGPLATARGSAAGSVRLSMLVELCRSLRRSLPVHSASAPGALVLRI